LKPRSDKKEGTDGIEVAGHDRLGGFRVRIVGDVIYYATNPRFLTRRIQERTTNAALIKLNQLGTVTEAIDGNAMEAASQLWIWYGNLPFFWNSTAAMDLTFWRHVTSHARTRAGSAQENSPRTYPGIQFDKPYAD
jgi:Enolase, C-terminal TIM barrel domain